MKALLIRANRNEVDAKALHALGIESEVDPYLTISAVANQAGAQRMLEALRSDNPKWLVITSTNVIRFWDELLEPGALEKTIRSSSNIQFAAIGEQTEVQLLELGARNVLVASSNDARSLAEQLADTPPIATVIPTGSISMKNIPDTLLPKGFELISEIVYQTEQVTKAPASVALISEGVFDCVILRSPSAARAFLNFNSSQVPALICAGKSTAAEVERLGFSAAIVAASPSPNNVADAAFECLRGK